VTKKAKVVTGETRPPGQQEHASDTPEARFTASLILGALARDGAEVGQSLDAIRGQRARALDALKSTPEGAKLAKAIVGAVDAAAPLVRSARQASVETRGSAVDAASMFVGWVAEHEGIADSPSAVAHLLSAARMGAAEARVHDEALAKGLTGDALEAALKLADRCATARRYDHAAALAIHAAAVEAAKKSKGVLGWFASAPRALPPARVVTADEPIDPEPTSEDDGPSTGEGDEPSTDEGDDPSTDDEPLERNPRPESDPSWPHAWKARPAPDDPSSMPSGSATGGRHRMAPSFAILDVDPTTLRAVVARQSGPDAAARAKALEHGLRWNDELGRYEKEQGS